jgi:hypothetical protein
LKAPVVENHRSVVKRMSVVPTNNAVPPPRELICLIAQSDSLMTADLPASPSRAWSPVRSQEDLVLVMIR